MQNYSRLRAQMKARMEELAIFYNDNLDDEKIHFFEKLRLQIKKALFNRPGKKLQQMTGYDLTSTNRELFSSVGPSTAAYFERPHLSVQEAAAWEMQAQRFGPIQEEPRGFYSQQQQHLHQRSANFEMSSPPRQD